MKKRILLSLVSFFAMTAMWASLVDAYQIYVTAGAAGKTGATAELTLNMKNKVEGICTWSCVLVLPEGVTCENVVAVAARYPEGYNPQITAIPGNDNTVKITCAGEVGVAMTGTDGAVATVTVKIASTVEPKDYIVTVKETKLVDTDDNVRQDPKNREYTWTIEQGDEPGVPGDLNGDGKVDIADAVTVLDIMAAGGYDAAADLNGDQKVDIADFVSILDIMAQQ